MEVRATASARSAEEQRREIAAALDRIEAAVAAGDRDLRRLGFWRIVAAVKLDRASVDAHADQIGRIDTAAFRAGVKLRAPVWLGNGVLLLATVAAGVAVGLSFALDRPTWKGLSLVAAGAIWSISLHSPTHWLVGSLVGIRWTHYFLGGPPPPRPGLKSDYGSYLRADPDSRAWMHASGAVATKLAPFLALAFWPASGAPAWAGMALAALGVLQIVTDVAFSTKTSDWKKFRREKAIARARRAALEQGAPPAEQAAVTGGAQMPPETSALAAEPVEPDGRPPI